MKYIVALTMLGLAVAGPAIAGERLRREPPPWGHAERTPPLACGDADGVRYGIGGDASCPGGSAADHDDADAAFQLMVPEMCNGLDDDGNGAVDDQSAQPVGTLGTSELGDSFADSLAPAGDVNGDGYSDLIVGASRADNGQTNEGRAYLYLGSASGLGLEPAWTAECDRSQCGLGSSVAGAGDVNGDGFDDVVIGAYQYTNGQSTEGAVFLYLGSATGLAGSPAWITEGNAAGRHLGSWVAGAGDVNGDGFDDLLAGSGTSPNRAWVWLGSSTGIPAATSWSGLGRQVAGAGDVNGDGYADVVVGGDSGGPYVYHGSSAGLAGNPAWAGQGIGSFVSSAGDVDGDGRSDVLVADSSYSGPETEEGRVLLFLGGAGGLVPTPAWTIESNLAFARLGSSLAAAGDLDGDGRGDVIVSAPFYNNGQTQEGLVLAYLGSPDGLANLPAWRVEGDVANARLGRSLAGARDLNGGGTGELVVGVITQSYSQAQIYRGEGMMTLGQATCGVGACERTVGNCIHGTPQICNPGMPTAEACNGIDEDCDGTSEQPLGGTPILSVTRVDGASSLSWTTVSGATAYDVVRGDLEALRASSGNFTAAIRACEANDLVATSLTVPGPPASAPADFFLVRGRMCAGGGTYDSGGPSQSGSRDTGIQASPLSCPFVYITEMTADPVAFLTGTPTAVTFQARIPAQPAAAPGSMQLLRGQDPAALCTLTDDGQSASGDLTAEDGIYSCVVTFQEPLATHIDVHVRTSAGSSASLALDVVDPLTIEQAQAILDVQDAAFAVWEQMRARFGDSPEARVQTAAAVARLGGVSAAGVTPDGVNVWIDHDSGIQGGLVLAPDDSLGAPSGQHLERSLSPSMRTSDPVTSPAGSPGALGSRRVLVWDALADAPSPGPEAAQGLSQSQCPPFDVTYLEPPLCTIDSVRTFSAYDIVVVAAHGATDKDGAVVFMTGQAATPQAVAAHAADLDAGYVTLGSKKNGAKVFGIRPNLIRRLPGPLGWGAVVINSSCMSANDQSMASAFSARGAQSYYGWTFYAWAAGAEHAIDQLVDRLVGEQTTGDALESIAPNPLLAGFCSDDIDVLCDDDPSDDRDFHTCVNGSCIYAELVLFGNQNAVVPPGEDGDPCHSARCCSTLYCTQQSVCAPCEVNGSSCASNEECCSEICSVGVCASCRPQGSACTLTEECCSGVCRSSGVCGPCDTTGGACGSNEDCCNGNCYDSPTGASTCYTGCNYGTACSQDSDCHWNCSVGCGEDPSDDCLCGGNPNKSCQGCGPDGFCSF